MIPQPLKKHMLNPRANWTDEDVWSAAQWLKEKMCYWKGNCNGVKKENKSQFNECLICCQIDEGFGVARPVLKGGFAACCRKCGNGSIPCKCPQSEEEGKK